MPLINAANGVFHGAAPVNAVYSRGSRVWPVESGPPVTISLVAPDEIMAVGPGGTTFHLDWETAWLTTPLEIPYTVATKVWTIDASGSILIPVENLRTNANVEMSTRVLGVYPAGKYYAVDPGGAGVVSNEIYVNGKTWWHRKGTLGTISGQTDTTGSSGPPVFATINPETLLDIKTEDTVYTSNSDVANALIRYAVGHGVPTDWHLAPGWVFNSLVGLRVSLYTGRDTYNNDLPKLFSNTALPVVAGNPPFETEIWRAENDASGDWQYGGVDIPIPAGFMEGTLFLTGGGERLANPPTVHDYAPGLKDEFSSQYVYVGVGLALTIDVSRA